MSSASLRRTYVILLFATILLGLAVHLHGHGLSAAVRDVLGDALWAAMIVWLVSSIMPTAAVPLRAALAVSICFAVEFSQMIKHPVLETVRHSTVGHIMIGSDFDARDLVAYSGGIFAALLLDKFVIRESKKA